MGQAADSCSHLTDLIVKHFVVHDIVAVQQKLDCQQKTLIFSKNQTIDFFVFIAVKRIYYQ